MACVSKTLWLSNPAPATKKETAVDTIVYCGFTIFVLKSSFSMVLRAFFIFMPFPRIASATTAGVSIASATHTIVQALNRSGIIMLKKIFRLNVKKFYLIVAYSVYQNGV